MPSGDEDGSERGTKGAGVGIDVGVEGSLEVEVGVDVKTSLGVGEVNVGVEALNDGVTLGPEEGLEVGVAGEGLEDEFGVGT